MKKTGKNTTTTKPTGTKAASAFGGQLRYWRGRRGLSQLELAMRAQASPRHISFVETGRSRPGREFIHRVADVLDIPLRERNALLQSAGLNSDYGEGRLDEQALEPFRKAMELMLANHEPYPAFVLDRWWNLIRANDSARHLFLEPFGMTADERPNLMDAFLGPGPWRDVVENWDETAPQLLARLRREAAAAGPDPKMHALLERAEKYLAHLAPPPDHRGEIVICPRIRMGDQIIETISMIARFFATRDVTLDELRVELIYPANDAAEIFFRGG